MASSLGTGIRVCAVGVRMPVGAGVCLGRMVGRMVGRMDGRMDREYRWVRVAACARSCLCRVECECYGRAQSPADARAFL